MSFEMYVRILENLYLQLCDLFKCEANTETHEFRWEAQEDGKKSVEKDLP